MEQLNHVDSEDFLAQLANTFTVGEKHIWDIVRKLKELTYKKALYVFEEHFGNMATFFYTDMTVTHRKNGYKHIVSRGDALSGAVKKHYTDFMKDALADLRKKDFSELVRKMEVYTFEKGEYLLVLPFGISEIFPPVSHEIERTKMLAGIISFDEFKEKHVTFDINALKPARIIDDEKDRLISAQRRGECFSVYLLSNEDVLAAASEAIGSVYGHLYEYHKGKEVTETIDRKKELISTLKTILKDIDLDGFDVKPEEPKTNIDIDQVIKESRSQVVIPDGEPDPIIEDIRNYGPYKRIIPEDEVDPVLEDMKKYGPYRNHVPTKEDFDKLEEFFKNRREASKYAHPIYNRPPKRKTDSGLYTPDANDEINRFVKEFPTFFSDIGGAEFDRASTDEYKDTVDEKDTP